ncbi:MAG: ABC transporter substrate-binding protein [Armatimonadota bacterium]
MPGQQRRIVLLFIGLIIGILAGVLLLPNQLFRKSAKPPAKGIPATTKATFPLTVVDTRKQQVTITQKPARIISLAPNVTEILFAVGAGDRVVADTTYCDYPAAAAKLTKVGGYTNPDIEKITTLAPDLILAARGTPQEVFTRLQKLGMTVVVIDEITLGEVARDIRLVGQVTGAGVKAEQVAAELESQQQTVVERTKNLPEAKRPRTLFLFEPGTLFSVGPGSHIDELIRLGGGRNIAAKTNTAWPQLSMETVVSLDPEVILISGMVGKDKMTTEKALAIFLSKPQWRSVSAVKNGRVAILDDDSVVRPGPRLFKGLSEVAAALHPELFPGGAAK